MKVLTGPAAAIVGKMEFIEHPVYKIPPDGTDLERLGAFAAKSCYDSFGADGRSCVENQRQILEYAHGSVLEHCHVALFLEGITRALTLELNRHRSYNISQRSTRYTKEEDSAIVLEPYYASIWNRYHCYLDADGSLQSPSFPQYEDDPEGIFSSNISIEFRLLYSFLAQCELAFVEYGAQVEMLMVLNPNNLEGFALRKWARGKARNVLPHALETRGTWTNNIRGWRWFIESRSNRHAEVEVRRLAELVLSILTPLAPTYFEDFRLTGIIDNIPEYTPTHHKV